MFKELVFRSKMFWADCRASVTVEAVLILPLLLSWFVGSFVFFDAFKNRNTSQKAAYTIADILSRHGPNPASPEAIENLAQLYSQLAYTRGGSAIRVSSVRWMEDEDKHIILWSHTSDDTVSELTDPAVLLTSFRDRIPLMADYETIILVETFTDYAPVFNVGWDQHIFENFVVTSPRFAGCLAWQEGSTVLGC